jgi:hypothetical protein
MPARHFLFSIFLFFFFFLGKVAEDEAKKISREIMRLFTFYTELGYTVLTFDGELGKSLSRIRAIRAGCLYLVCALSQIRLEEHVSGPCGRYEIGFIRCGCDRHARWH